jgi:hypothetical protein
MITSAIVTREEFLAWIGGRGLDQPFLFDLKLVNAKMRKGRYAIIWEGDDFFKQRGNAVIAVPRSDLRDFFAFVTTYVSDYVPFTAFFRVVTLDELGELLDAPAYPEVEKLDDVRKFVGVGISEAFMRVNGKIGTLEEMPVAAVGATLSSVLAASLYNGAGGASLQDIANRWGIAKKFLSDDEGDDQIATCVQIFQTVALALGGRAIDEKNQVSRQVAPVIVNVRSRGVMLEDDWFSLSRNFPGLIGSFSTMRGPREDRIKGFMSAMANVRQSAIAENRRMAECIAGCLLALVGDGSFQYLQLSREFNPDMRASTLWFGMWASLFRNSDVLTAGECLGRRAARDCFAQRRLFDDPKDDIAFEELQVVASAPAITFRTAQQAALSVEIAPNISARFRINRGQQHNASESVQQATIDDLSELRFLLVRAERITDHLGNVLGLPPDRGSRLRKKTR